MGCLMLEIADSYQLSAKDKKEGLNNGIIGLVGWGF